MCKNTFVVALPCASIVWFVFFIFCPSCSNEAVWLLGAAPGGNFDFSRLSFHIPRSGLLCAKVARGNAQATKHTSAMLINVERRFMILLRDGRRAWTAHRE